MKYVYSPKMFMADIPKELLKEYFDAKELPGPPTTKGLLKDFPWSEANGTYVDDLFAAWQGLDGQAVAATESDFRAIHDLANPDGIRVLVEEGQFHGLDLAGDLDPREGFLNKAMWVFLKYPHVFLVAHRFFATDNASSLYRRKRTDLPALPPDLTPEVREAFKQAISAYYWKNEGRGKRCHMDVYLRGGHVHYFFVHPEDYAGTFMGFTGKGEFSRQPQKPAFEVVFIFDERTGVLELLARGERKTKEALQRIFGSTMLGIDLGPEEKSRRPHDLQCLADRDFEFKGLAEQGIRSITITGLRVRAPGVSVPMSFGPKRGATPLEILDAMEAALNTEQIAIRDLVVDHAHLRAKFEPVNDDVKVVDFGISPRSHNLTKDTPDQLAIKECLKQSGIIHERPARNSTPEG